MRNLLKEGKRRLKASRFYEWIRGDLLDVYALKSYSQEGEDLLLRRLFATKARGFYVDVGAHHPKRFSNTYHFYRRGWRGINVDAMPGSMKAFERSRPRDINVECAIAQQEKSLCYYIFNEPALNGFSAELSLSRASEHAKYKVLETRTITTRSLQSVLAEYLPQGETIDFMSVDVEGMDLEVLQSNDWSRFRPEALLVEVLSSSIESLTADPISIFLRNNGYQIFAKCVNTVIFRKERS